MMCKLIDKLPSAGHWYYELKFDGFRALALKNGSHVQLISRNNNHLSRNFPELIDSVAALPCEQAVLDGEIVALDDRGWPSFQALQNSANGSRNIFYFAFDLLHLEGRDTTALPIEERRAFLEPLITPDNPRLLFSTFLEGAPDDLACLIKKHGLEGIIAKRAGSFYEPGRRSGTWLKYKNLLEENFIIGGYTTPRGLRDAFGALLVGHCDHGKLRFVGKVGTGFTWNQLRELHDSFQVLRRQSCPFVNLPEKSAGRWGEGLTSTKMRDCTWLEPKLICRVGFTEWTDSHHLRHPCFKGLVPDKENSLVAN